MISYNNAKKLILQSYRNHVIDASYRLNDGYLFLPVPKSLGRDEYILDGYCKVTSDGKLEGYSPVFNPEEFKQALKNRIE